MRFYISETPRRLVHDFDAETVRQLYGGSRHMLYSYWDILTKDASGQFLRRAMDIWPGDGLLIDSGLFTFLNNPNSGGRTMDFYRYANEYLEWLDKVGFRGLMVDVDAQKFTSPDEMHRIRELFDKRRTFFVWHPQDRIPPGEFACDKPYCAFAMREGKRPRAVSNLAALVAAKHFTDAGAERVHILGTQNVHSNHTWSCDSTSWCSGPRFGTVPLWDAHARRFSLFPRTSPAVAEASKRASEALPLAWAALGRLKESAKVVWCRTVGAHESRRAEITLSREYAS